MKVIDLFVKILVFVKILSQGRILTNKFGLFARILVCLSEFWFVCQHFGLFVSTLVCLQAFWVTKLPTNKPKCRQTTQLDKQKKNLDP